MSPKGHWVAFPTALMHSSFLSIVVNREKPFPCFPRHALPLFLLLPKGSSPSLGSKGSPILVSQVSNASTSLCGECWQNPHGLFTCWQLNMLPKVNKVFFSPSSGERCPWMCRDGLRTDCSLFTYKCPECFVCTCSPVRAGLLLALYIPYTLTRRIHKVRCFDFMSKFVWQMHFLCDYCYIVGLFSLHMLSLLF